MQGMTGRFGSRRNAIVGGLSALVAVLAGGGVWRYSAAWQREAEAKARMSGLIDRFQSIAHDREGFERVITEAQEIRARYPASPEARLARYYMAISEESLGRTDRSMEHLEALIAEGDVLMKPLAQFALGRIYTNHGDNARAMATFKQLEEGGAYGVGAHHSGGHSVAEPPVRH
jgi:predicted negative regulator of RcsB-dependent stress response